MERQKFTTQHSFRTEFKIHSRSTELSIDDGRGILLRCYVANDYHARNRRQFLLSIYNQVLPLFEFMVESKIHHNHHINDFTSFDKVKILSTKQAISLKSEENKIGYIIRGIRTKLGKTQVEFAKDLDIHPNYLSKVEKGKCVAGRKLLSKIYEMKNAPEIGYP